MNNLNLNTQNITEETLVEALISNLTDNLGTIGVSGVVGILIYYGYTAFKAVAILYGIINYLEEMNITMIHIFDMSWSVGEGNVMSNTTNIIRSIDNMIEGVEEWRNLIINTSDPAKLNPFFEGAKNSFDILESELRRLLSIIRNIQHHNNILNKADIDQIRLSTNNVKDILKNLIRILEGYKSSTQWYRLVTLGW